MVSWADTQESDEEVLRTEDIVKKQKVELIELGIQVVSDECTETDQWESAVVKRRRPRRLQVDVKKNIGQR